MKLSQSGVDFIVRFEGLLKKLPDGRFTSYRCPAGVWTIYAGCTEGVRPGMIITDAEGRAMFARELAKFEKAVNRLVKVPLNQNEYDALVSFAYNCGEGALARSTILKRLNAGDRKGAAAAFASWNKGGGRVLPGLVRRRRDEAVMFLRPAPFKIPAADGERKTVRETVKQSPSLRLQINALISGAMALVVSFWDWLVGSANWLFSLLPFAATDVSSTVGATRTIAEQAGVPLPAKILIGVTAVCLILLFHRQLKQKQVAP